MVKEDNTDKASQIIELGGIFSSIDLKLVLKKILVIFKDFTWSLPEVGHGSGKGRKTKEGIYRLFLIGQKQLPEIVEGKSTSKERNLFC